MTESSSLREQGLAAFRFAGKFLATLALFIAALRPGPAAEELKGGSIDAMFLVGGYPVPAIRELAASAPIRLVPIEGKIVDGLKKDFSFYTRTEVPAGSYRGVNSATTSLGFSALWLIFYVVGYLVSYYYDTEFLNPLDRCAFLVYLSSVGLSAFLSRDNAGVVTPSLLWSAAVGMAAIAVAFIVQRSRLKGKGQAA